MEERGILEFRYNKNEIPKLIKVIGVGGGGGNAVSKMYNDNKDIKGVSFLLCNTDRQALMNSPVPNKVVLGEKITFGLGAGNKPDTARTAAEESRDEIKEILEKDETKMVFITAGMGGGTGTGAAPIIGNIAMSLGILTVGIVTIPFRFEGRNKILQALNGVQELRKNVDAILIVNNERLIDVYGDLSIDEGFKKADETLSNATKGICDMIYEPTKINLDFNDVKTTLEKGGVAVINTGIGRGPNRLKDAIEQALNSPLLNNNNVYSSKKVLISIFGSSTNPPTMNELSYMEEFVSKLTIDFDNIWGYSPSENLSDDQISVTILASGFDIDTTFDSINGIKNIKKDNISVQEEEKRTDHENQLIASFYSTPDGLFKKISKPLLLSVSELDDDEIIHHLEDTVALNRNLSPVEFVRNKRKETIKSLNNKTIKIDIISSDKEKDSKNIINVYDEGEETIIFE